MAPVIIVKSRQSPRYLVNASSSHGAPIRPRPRRSVKILGAGAIILGAVIALMGVTVSGSALAVLGAATLVVYIDYTLMPGWLIGAGTFFCLHHLGAYTISPLGQIIAHGYVDRQYIDGFIMAQWGAVLGLLTWSVIYPRVFHITRKVISGHEKTSPRRVSKTTLTLYTLLLTVLSIAIWIFQVRVGLSKIDATSSAVSTLDAEIAVGFQFATYVACFLLAYFARARGHWWVMTWALGVGTFCTWHLLDGSRAPVIMAGCFSACGFYYAGTSFRRVVLTAIAGCIPLVPLFGVVRIYRDTNIGAAESISDRVQGFEQAIIDFAATRGATTDSGAGTFLERLSPQPVDYVFVKTPGEIPYAGFSGIDRVLYMFVPQSLVSNRPDLIDGNQVAIQYGAGRVGTTGNSLSVVGDGYRRFGWPGIPFLYAIIAACSAIISATAWTRRERLEWVSSLIILLVCLNGENTMSTLISTFYYVIWIFPKYFMLFLAVRVVSELCTEGKRKRLALHPSDRRQLDSRTATAN